MPPTQSLPLTLNSLFYPGCPAASLVSFHSDCLDNQDDQVTDLLNYFLPG